jgi:hypothetical protein
VLIAPLPESLMRLVEFEVVHLPETGFQRRRGRGSYRIGEKKQRE